MTYDDWKLDSPSETDVDEIAAYYGVRPSNVTNTMIYRYEDDRAADYGDRQYDRATGK